MYNCDRHYIDGEWIESSGGRIADVIDPTSEQRVGSVVIGTAKDADLAVAAARRAFGSYSTTTREERLILLDRIIVAYQERLPDLALAISAEMGAPKWLAEQMQAVLGLVHLQTARSILEKYSFSELGGSTAIVREPVGVCALITPWNWPMNQIACKVAPALATGCTVVLKPSEAAPISATIFTEILEAAGVPSGVFNMVHGDGAGVGSRLSSHPDVDMVSFTGSTRAGVEVARNAAPTVKRVHQELGGKSPNIVLRSADLTAAVSQGVDLLMLNSGQSCNAPSRMLVPAERMGEAARIAGDAAERWTPSTTDERMGPVVSATQWKRIQDLIAIGTIEGTLISGGAGRPESRKVGFYVKPTIFADVDNKSTIAREEVFGPVLVLIGYEDEEEAIAIANDTPYGLAAYVQGEPQEAVRVAERLRAGQVMLNGAALDFGAPFGGYKQSGNGREWGEHAFADFLELKAIVGRT